MARGIADWQRCQYPSRYVLNTGHMRKTACVEHLQPMIEDTLADNQLGKANMTALLVSNVRSGSTHEQCDYRFRTSA